MKVQKLCNRLFFLILSILAIGFIISFSLGSQINVVGAAESVKPLPEFRSQATAPIIVDHTSTDITAIPQQWIEQAKSDLHIAYGHTSHGSQLTSGMSGLVGFANNGGLGLSLPENIFQWNFGGTGGALDVRDGAMGGDLGGNWANETRNYLGTPTTAGRGSNHPDINVIIWSWCGQVNDYEPGQEMLDWYLTPMSLLEQDYPGITFVYMTGHAEGTAETGSVHASNQYIRNYAITNNKVLFDFYDIELYDPDGNYYGDRYATDGCNYDYNNDGITSESGDPALPINGDRNWATTWQTSHTQNTDWYSCSCAHSQALNCNQKAYAAWWLWARITGWNGASDENFAVEKTVSSPAANNGQTITYTVVIRSMTTPLSATVHFTDELPATLSYVANSLTATLATQGIVTDTNAPTLAWSGVLSPTPVVTISYAAAVNTPTSDPQLIPNTATVTAQGSKTVSSTVTMLANGLKTYLPAILKD